MLDATAGNRLIWPNKNPPLTVFMDKETQLIRPPDIFAVWQKLPFRDDIFDCVIFDPPHMIIRGKFNPWYSDPKSKGGRKGSWYGYFSSRTELLTSIYEAAQEFYRVSKRLCFKWYEDRFTLWQILPLFKPWKEVSRFKPHPRMGRRAWRKSSSKTWWVTFIRASI